MKGSHADPPGNPPLESVFQLPRPATAMAFTGERLTSAAEGQIVFEHHHRYCFARDLCGGRDVLDIAAGEGYGAALLAGVARGVTGVDIDPASVAHAATNYAAANLRFLHGDALALPLPEAAVDVVVSFETLEHLADHTRFIAEIRRVLRPAGVVVISTPDRDIYSAPCTPANPYHQRELTRAEFGTLLAGHFAHFKVLAQRAVLGSLLAAPGDGLNGVSWRSYAGQTPETVLASDGLAAAPFLIAVASDGPLPPLASSVYLDSQSVHDLVYRAGHFADIEALAAEHARQRDIARHEAGAEAELRRLAAAAAERARVAAAAALAAETCRLDAAQKENARLRSALLEVESDLAGAQAVAAELRETRDALLRSTSWRVTAPVRGLANAMRIGRVKSAS